MQKVALITGAAGGLGQTLAGNLSEAGWQLVVVSRDAGVIHHHVAWLAAGCPGVRWRGAHQWGQATLGAPAGVSHATA